MTSQEKAELLAELANIAGRADDDTETAHMDADAVLCSALKKLGHHVLVDAWCKVRKWYA